MLKELGLAVALTLGASGAYADTSPTKACPADQSSRAYVESSVAVNAAVNNEQWTVHKMTFAQAGAVLATLEAEIGPAPAHAPFAYAIAFVYRGANGKDVAADVAFFAKDDCTVLSASIGTAQLPSFEKLWQ